MKAVNSASIYSGDMLQNKFLCPLSGQKEESTGLFGKTAGLDSRIEAKREEIKTRVHQIIDKQFKSDSKLSDSSKGKLGKIDVEQDKLTETKGEIRRLHKSQADMREEYNIKEDSQEHQDVELIRKIVELHKYEREEESSRRDDIIAALEDIAQSDAHGYRSDWASTLSDDEWNRAVELSSQPFTLYQEKCIADDSIEEYYNEIIDESNEEIKKNILEIEATKAVLANEHGMTDAQKIAEGIEKAGSQEIIGILQSEAMNHIDEELEEVVESAKEATEEKEAQEEKEAKAEGEKQAVTEVQADRNTQAEVNMPQSEMIRRREKDQKEAQKIIDAAADNETDKKIIKSTADKEVDMREIQAEISIMIEEAKLFQEDQKGLVVDKFL